MKKEFQSTTELKEKAKILLENFLQTQKAVTRVGWRDWIPFAVLKPKLPLDKFADFIKNQQKITQEFVKNVRDHGRKGPKEGRAFAKALEEWLQALLPCYDSLGVLIAGKKQRLIDPKQYSVSQMNRDFKFHDLQVKELFAKAKPMQVAYAASISPHQK